MQIKDEETGETVIAGVYKRDDIYHGKFIGNAPDLVVGFKDGYRVSWQTTLGGIPKTIMENNMKKWSGDHCSFDYRDTQGVLHDQSQDSEIRSEFSGYRSYRLQIP